MYKIIINHYIYFVYLKIMKWLLFLFLVSCATKEVPKIIIPRFGETEIRLIKGEVVDFNQLNPVALDEFDRTPLFYCESENCVNVLLKKGAHIEHRDVFNETVLRRVVRLSNLKMAKVFLDAGAKIDDHSKLSNPIFFEALANQDLDMLKLLTKYRFNPNLLGFLDRNWTFYNFATEFMEKYTADHQEWIKSQIKLKRK